MIYDSATNLSDMECPLPLAPMVDFDHRLVILQRFDGSVGLS
jgi:hypothetical protein